ncbi:MAG: DNA-binding protein [Candidatus Syntrophoarchaeum caldarius]|uniref:DNA-binding protein n=1 Tax=Candidatus Syntropharchaeum caldarium TaxID=1838285 RepID=A0A1F2PAI6_9EURY|nr:MAG: DNA-binding protein [Candidatus Syntrophoarchaeum caldarius]
MRKEVKEWWKQALKDLDSAEKNLNIGEYYLTAFLCQQSVEKSLKALYIHKLKESPGPTHSLIFLGKEVGIPEEYHSTLRRLSPDFVITRYPDAAHTVPYELYDEEIAKERLERSMKVIEWIRKELMK